MPTYEYQCADCGDKFEVRATMQEKQKGFRPVCPTCGKRNTECVPSAVAIGSTRSTGASGCCGGTGCCSPKRGR